MIVVIKIFSDYAILFWRKGQIEACLRRLFNGIKFVNQSTEFPNQKRHG